MAAGSSPRPALEVWPKLKQADRQFLADWPSLSAAKRKALLAMLAAMKE
jgi:hypothetical protein